MATAHQAMRADLMIKQIRIKKIAVLTDFSANADTALRYAATLARGYGASLVLAHAYLPPACACAAPEAGFVFQAFDAFRKALEDRLLDKTRAAYLQDIHCSVSLYPGMPGDLLEELTDADLIVVGTAGETGLEKRLLGSTAELVFRTCVNPVLTVGPHCRCNGEGQAALGTVLYATDLSSGTPALPYALSIAKEHDAELILLHVIQDKNIVLSAEQALARTEAIEELRKLVPDDASLRCKTTYLVDFGAADAAILDEARIHNAQIIVMGARGGGKFPSIASRFAGGTAYRVVVNAACPVLTIREPAHMQVM